MWLLLLLLSVKSTRSEFMDQQLLIWLNWEIKQTPDDHQHHHRAHKSTVIVVLCVVQDGKSWWGCLVLIYAGFNLFISYCRWHWGVGEGCGGRSSSIKPPIHPSIDRSPIRWWSMTWDYKPNTSCIIFTTGDLSLQSSPRRRLTCHRHSVQWERRTKIYRLWREFDNETIDRSFQWNNPLTIIKMMMVIGRRAIIETCYKVDGGLRRRQWTNNKNMNEYHQKWNWVVFILIIYNLCLE